MILINKPTGITSHDVVDKVRHATGERRVGHAGTLDPFATGLLIVLVGREETKRQNEFMKLSKVYEATFVFGEERDTDDVTGEIRSSFSSKKASKPPLLSKVKHILNTFEGKIEQVPPAYSAVKIKGKKAYELARKGETPKLKPKKVTIYNIEILNYKYPELKIKTRVGSGTYIRALARDIGRELRVGAYVKDLKRISIGKYKLEDAVNLKDLKNKKNSDI